LLIMLILVGNPPNQVNPGRISVYPGNLVNHANPGR